MFNLLTGELQSNSCPSLSPLNNFRGVDEEELNGGACLVGVCRIRGTVFGYDDSGDELPSDRCSDGGDVNKFAVVNRGGVFHRRRNV